MEPIDLERAEPGFLKGEAGTLGEEMRGCFTCRTCTASCPVAALHEAFNPFRIIRLALYGLRDEILKSPWIWLCTGCYTCQERCPQGVRITDVMTALKNLAVREGHAPPGIRAQRDMVRASGRIYPLDDFDNKKREKMGLVALPTASTVAEHLLS